MGMMSTHASIGRALMIVAAASLVLCPLRAQATQETPWSLRTIEPAGVNEVSRALWWNDAIGLVVGSAQAVEQDDTLTIDALHVGSAWRMPLDHGIDLTLRSELVGTRTSVDAWRSGATWSVDLAPNASLSASAWWSLPQADATVGPASPDGEGSALVGFTLRF